MEFTLKDFTQKIRDNLYENFPYESDELNLKKHKNRPLHIRDIAFGWLPTTENNGSFYFDIGSDYAEENYPYYHILEDAEVIRKKGQSTKGTRGSQAQVKELSKRDYGRINFNGKTYSREYRKNVRGERSRADKATRFITGANGRRVRINKNADYYKNIHFRYIERTLDTTLPWIASELGLKMGRTEITDLAEEYATQESEDRIMNIMSSFEGE